MKRVEENIDILKVLAKGNKKMRRAILNNSDGKLVICLCECALNCIKGTVEMPKHSIDKLKNSRNTIHKLLENKRSIKDKRKILVQRGESILPVIIPAVLSAFSTLFK